MSAAGDEVHLARTASAIGDSRPRGVESFVAHLLGMSKSLVYIVEAGFDTEGWAWKPNGKQRGISRRKPRSQARAKGGVKLTIGL